MQLTRGRSQTTFTDFWPFLTPLPPWLTSLLNKICHIYLVTLTFDKPPPPPMAVNVVCERPLTNRSIDELPIFLHHPLRK